jgi:hypothetical protein
MQAPSARNRLTALGAFLPLSTSDGDQTILAIEVRGMPLDKIQFYGAGWQEHAERLAGYLAGREPSISEARWNALVAAYQELAARIG